MKDQILSSADHEAELKTRFHVPPINRDFKTFVVAGKFMTKYAEFQNPFQRYVFVSPDLRCIND